VSAFMSEKGNSSSITENSVIERACFEGSLRPSLYWH
jgi:hypothetical protein